MPLYTFVDNAVPTSSQWNSNVRDQVITQCTSGTRPASPVEGQHIDESDTERLLRYSGSAWTILTEPLQTWTPTITQGAAVAGTVNRGWYRRQNGLWQARLKWTSSAAGTAGNNITVSLPLTMVNAADIGGSFTFLDSGTTIYEGTPFESSTTVCNLQVTTQTGNLGITPAFTIAANDVLRLSLFGTY